VHWYDRERVFRDAAAALGGEDVDAGTYAGRLVFLTSDPKSEPLIVELSLEVTLPETFGGVRGRIRDVHTGEPLPANVRIDTVWDGSPYPVRVTAGSNGRFTAFGPAGTWPARVSLGGYVAQRFDVTIEAGLMRPGVNRFLHRDQPHAAIHGGPFSFVLRPGGTAKGSLTVSNPDGHDPLTFEIGEVNLRGASVAALRGPRTLPDGIDPNARTTEGFGPQIAPDVRALHSPGDVLAAWPPEGVDLPWGVAFTGDVWLTDALESDDACGFVDGCTIHEFSVDGEPGSVLDAPWVDVFAADMAYDAERDLLWTMQVGESENGLWGIDPADGSVEQIVTGDPWTDISQRGVAYDPGTDTFYVGGWNEGIVYHVAGPSWAEPGAMLGQCTPSDPNISGLAWNPAFSLLWEATNSETDAIYLIDPATCDTLTALPHPDGSGFTGAGIEIDTVGNLWTVGQNSGEAYLVESGLPNFSDVPWLSVEPLAGTVTLDGSVELTVTADSTGLEAGVYHGQLVVQTNDPDNSAMVVPVTLTVPALQQGINAGGGAYVTVDGVSYAADQAYGSGGFGYVGASSTRSTNQPIAGTDDDALYQTLRLGMSAYRVDLPDGVYRVDLAFAETLAGAAGSRVFSVSLEGASVLPNLDVFAAAGGRYIALDHSFVVEVTDGTLDIGFTAQRGDKPIVNGILVTNVP
jgi:hypothetical protein